jgi:hypothetical protein
MSAQTRENTGGTEEEMLKEQKSRKMRSVAAGIELSAETGGYS